jgi:hypothetical protein
MSTNIADAAGRPWQLGPISAVVLFSICGCGGAFEDNGTHLAYALEKGASELRASKVSELVLHYKTLDSLAEPYYVEITPSIAVGQASNIWGSYLVVSGRSSGGASYQGAGAFLDVALFLAVAFGIHKGSRIAADGGAASVYRRESVSV